MYDRKHIAACRPVSASEIGFGDASSLMTIVAVCVNSLKIFAERTLIIWRLRKFVYSLSLSLSLLPRVNIRNIS